MTSSQTKSEFFSKMINDIDINTSNICKTKAVNSQTIYFGTINAPGCILSISNLNQEINSRINATCFEDEKYAEELIASIYKQIEIMRNSGLKEDKIMADKIRDIVVNKINVNNITECMASTLNRQSVYIAEIDHRCESGETLTIDNISQKITQDLILSCIDNNVIKQIKDVEIERDETIKKNAEIKIEEEEESKNKTIVVGFIITFLILGILSIIYIIYKYYGK